MPTLSLTPAEETEAAQSVHHAGVFSLVAESDAALAFVYEDQPYRRLKIHKLVHLVQANTMEVTEVVPFVHVMSRTADVALETDSAEALTKIQGGVIFKTITPAVESG